MTKEENIKEMESVIRDILNPYNDKDPEVEAWSLVVEEGWQKQTFGTWVRKEHVINEYGDTESSFVCSCCNKKYKRGEHTPKRFVEEHKFCPNCGANMKESADE